MVTVTLYRDRLGICGFLAAGHSGYRPPGEDIVCAAISALTQTASLALKKVAGVRPKVEVRDGYLRCLLPKKLTEEQHQRTQIILETLSVGLNAIAEEYHDFLRIKEVRS